MRPIDADAFRAELMDAVNAPFLKEMSPENWAQAYESCVRALDRQPTINYAPVVHGSWVEYDEGNPLPLDWRYRCSLCGCPQDYAHNFCPECGARMDGEK